MGHTEVTEYHAQIVEALPLMANEAVTLTHYLGAGKHGEPAHRAQLALEVLVIPPRSVAAGSCLCGGRSQGQQRVRQYSAHPQERGIGLAPHPRQR